MRETLAICIAIAPELLAHASPMPRQSIHIPAFRMFLDYIARNNNLMDFRRSLESLVHLPCHSHVVQCLIPRTIIRAHHPTRHLSAHQFLDRPYRSVNDPCGPQNGRSWSQVQTIEGFRLATVYIDQTRIYQEPSLADSITVSIVKSRPLGRSEAWELYIESNCYAPSDRRRKGDSVLPTPGLGHVFSGMSSHLVGLKILQNHKARPEDKRRLSSPVASSTLRPLS
jgi:hypothetical protein